VLIISPCIPVSRRPCLLCLVLFVILTLNLAFVDSHSFAKISSTISLELNPVTIPLILLEISHLNVIELQLVSCVINVFLHTHSNLESFTTNSRTESSVNHAHPSNFNLLAPQNTVSVSKYTFFCLLRYLDSSINPLLQNTKQGQIPNKRLTGLF
jgi:hypothetical protein